jgi:hypothetical protein
VSEDKRCCPSGHTQPRVDVGHAPGSPWDEWMQRMLPAEGQGKPMVLLVTAGRRYEQTAFRPLLRIAIRYETRATHDLAMLTLAAITLWL